MASLTISGFFTLGIGTLIGAGTVDAMLILCETDAQRDRDKCLGEDVLVIHPVEAEPLVDDYSEEEL